jgi:hypothetical protein
MASLISQKLDGVIESLEGRVIQVCWETDPRPEVRWAVQPGSFRHHAMTSQTAKYRLAFPSGQEYKHDQRELTRQSEQRTAGDVRAVELSLAAIICLSVAAGERLETVGSLARANDKEILLARQVRKGDTVLTFRNDRGFPIIGRQRGR